MMNRRRFLGLLGLGGAGLLATEAIPLNRVWSFPKKIVIAQPRTIRFVEAYDPTFDKMIQRFDVSYGFDLELPAATERCALVRVYRDDQMQPALDLLAEHNKVVAPPAEVLRPRYPVGTEQLSYCSTRTLLPISPGSGPWGLDFSAMRMQGYRKREVTEDSARESLNV